MRSRTAESIATETSRMIPASAIVPVPAATIGSLALALVLELVLVGVGRAGSPI